MRLTKKRIGEKVVSLMEDGLFDILLKEIKRDIVSEMLNTQPNDADKREELYVLTKALDRLDAKILAFVTQYKLENDE